MKQIKDFFKGRPSSKDIKDQDSNAETTATVVTANARAASSEYAETTTTVVTANARVASSEYAETTATVVTANTRMASSEYVFNVVHPGEWKRPEMLPPVEQASTQETTSSADLGPITTDAKLYTLQEKKIDGIAVHSVLQMPSALPGDNALSTNTLNILMADGSGSMHSYFRNVQQSWNEHVAPNLSGNTRIFTFDNRLKFRRTGKELLWADFDSGGTELTGALQTIISEVYQCREKYVNVFLVTDGDHNGCDISPSSIIDMMVAPQSKVCNVFVLGLGNGFPVQYSIDIRSRLHNGSSNLPSLFWAKRSSSIDEQMQDIGSRISGGASLSMKLDAVGASLPGLPTRDTFHLEEWVYFVHEPEKYKELNVSFNNQTAKIILKPENVNMGILLEIIRQWNSLIIQLKGKKEHIPEDILPFMERLFDALQTTAPRTTGGAVPISERIQKDTKTENMEFRQLLNGIKTILTTEKYHDQIQLAETILSTTVTRSKYEVKTLQLKGHTDKEYEADVQEFMKVYNDNKETIRSLKISEEDKCQATHSSTLSDLQDEDFPKLMDENKFDFLKKFTISGIPVFAPTRDSVTLNPWSFSVQKMLKHPYTIMSQAAMEKMAQNSSDKFNKEVQAKKDDDDTNFNAIVPVFSPSAAKEMQPIVRTRIYAMCVTFATLKNPHMIDFNIHMAALGVTWVRCLFENPDTPRPEHVRSRMESIEATAALYFDRPSYANYARILREDTPQALMTESTITLDNNKPIKCESIIKPMFLLNLIQRCDGQKVDVTKVADIVRMMLLEYIGRCISHYKSKEGDDTPYTDFFAETLADQDKKKQWIQKFVEDAKKEMAQADTGLLKVFYTLEKARKAATLVAKEELGKQKDKMIAQITIKINMNKVEQLRNVSVAGDVSWGTIKTFARVVGLSEDTISDLFSEESAFVYTTHALKYRSSRDRLSKPMDTYDACLIDVTKAVQEENLRLVSKDLYEAIIESLENVWLKEYLDVHSEVVEPMTRQQIIFQANNLGVQVTEDTFDNVYKRYRPNVKLLGNACQTKLCPYFLQPNKRYNQHASVERSKGTSPFPHALHQTTHQYRERDLPTVVAAVASGSNTKEKKPIPQDTVDKLTSDIKKLKNIYSEQVEAESMDSQ